MRHLQRIPLISKLGLLVMVLAGALDVVIHVVADAHTLHGGFGVEHGAHLLGIAGMVLVLAGVVTYGARRQLRQRAATNGGLDGHANR